MYYIFFLFLCQAEERQQSISKTPEKVISNFNCHQVKRSNRTFGNTKKYFKMYYTAYYKTQWIQSRDLTGLVRTMHLKYTTRVLQNVLD
jgi:hypothetical protein